MPNIKFFVIAISMIFHFFDAAEQKVRCEKNINKEQVFDVLKQYTPMAKDNYAIVAGYLNDWQVSSALIDQSNYCSAINKARKILHASDGRLIVVGNQLMLIWQEVSHNNWQCVFVNQSGRAIFQIKNRIFIHFDKGIYELINNQLVQKTKNINTFNIIDDLILVTYWDSNNCDFYDIDFNLLQRMQIPFAEKIATFQGYTVIIDNCGCINLIDQDNKLFNEFTHENQFYRNNYSLRTLFNFQDKLICVNKKKNKLIAITKIIDGYIEHSDTIIKKNNRKISRVYKINDEKLAILGNSSIVWLEWYKNYFVVTNELFLPDADLVADISFMNDGRIAVLHKCGKVDIYSNEELESHLKKKFPQPQHPQPQSQQQQRCIIL